MAATRVVTTQLVSVPESNGINICMGGTVLSWIDVAAGLAAKTLARAPCVTASVDSVQFLRPCHVGSVVIIAAMVNRTFRSSMEVGVRVAEECPLTGARHYCCSAYLTFVTAAPRGQPRRMLPKVRPTTSRHATIYRDAERRRERRLEQRARVQRDPELAAAEAACRLVPVTHREGTPSLPPALPFDPGDSTSPRHRLRVAPSLTTAHITHIIMPQHANSIGITFGGQVMRWMEQAAFIVASRVSRGGHLLTAGMDGITFLDSTRVGDTVYVEAQATAVFGSSMEVMISVWGEVPEEGVPFHCGDAYATIVSVNVQGGPVDIPMEIVPRTEQEKMRYAGAVARRAARLELRATLMDGRNRRMSVDQEGPGAWSGSDSDTMMPSGVREESEKVVLAQTLAGA